MMNSETEIKQVRCPRCERLLGKLESGEVTIRCVRCKVDCKAVVKLIPQIVVEIVTERCDTAPASA